MSEGGQGLSPTIYKAISDGIEPPDILGDITGMSERLDKNDIEWLTFAKPQLVAPGNDVEVGIIMQNTRGAEAVLGVSLEAMKHPNILSSKLDIPRSDKICLRPLEVGIFFIPIHVRDNAGQGEYTVKIELSPKFSESSARVRPKAPKMKAHQNWGRLIAGNVIGIGLAATVGLGFKVIPQSFSGIAFQVSKLGSKIRTEFHKPEFRSIWTVSDWERTLQLKASISDNWQAHRRGLSFVSVFRAALVHVAEEYPHLLPGEHAVLAFSMAGTVEALLSDAEGEQFLREMVVRVVSASGVSAAEAVSANHLVGSLSEALVTLTTIRSIDALTRMNLYNIPQEQIPTHAKEMVSWLRSGHYDAPSFWIIYGTYGLQWAKAEGKADLKKHKKAIVRALDDRVETHPALGGANRDALLGIIDT